MADDIEFSMTYPCYFLCGDRGGLVCITVDFVTCLCLFTDMDALRAFQYSQQPQQQDKIAFPLEVACVTCHTQVELINRLAAVEEEIAKSGVHHLAINPAPEQPVAYVTIREFIEALPQD
jgi:hypothetical protein